ncbi:MAG: c-type cytochrome [Candidatus Thiodiazotropha endolucinida]|nr:c-type cytochrome [Candidatus Thiodiazotropha taylori]MCW4276721.1 c-type cytochrome [Candidatus Thiodiazotropha taylori]
MRRFLTYLSGLVVALVAPTTLQAKDEQMLDLANARGCFICHQVAADNSGGKPLGPSYQEVAVRYRDDQQAFDQLLDRVIHGTAYRDQKWEGKVAMRFMPPNVNVSREEAAALVRWIIDLDVDQKTVERLQRHGNMLRLSSLSGCNICHRVEPVTESRVVPLAPSFREIAGRYQANANAKSDLVDSVLKGTQGGTRMWENVNMRFMPPNVNVRDEDAAALVDWILSLETKGLAKHARVPAQRPVKKP